MPHSRYNALPAEELTDSGYQILTQSVEAGVDLFARQDETLLLFLQGHPEYEADTLLREYRRDLGRFLHGEQGAPHYPRGYFDAQTERRLQALTASGQAAELLAECERLASSFRRATPWRRNGVRLYRNWLGSWLQRRPATPGAPAWPNRPRSSSDRVCRCGA